MSRIQPPPGADTTGEMPLDAAPVIVESSDGVAVITLNRPAKRNAVTLAMWGALAERTAELAADPAVRILIIRGAGDHFCAGADISELTNGPGGEYARINWAAEEAIAAFPGPTIAEIRGNCIGGGVSIASACDLRFAAEGSTFGITPAKLGIVYPTNALERTVRLIGGSATKHLMFSGDLIDADRALRIGLVDEVVPAAGLTARVEAYVATLLERSHLTQVATKAMVQEVLTDARVKPATTLKWETAMDQSGEVREGVAAFLGKRAVRWPWRRN